MECVIARLKDLGHNFARVKWLATYYAHVGNVIELDHFTMGNAGRGLARGRRLDFLGFTAESILLDSCSYKRCSLKISSLYCVIT